MQNTHFLLVEWFSADLIIPGCLQEQSVLAGGSLQPLFTARSSALFLRAFRPFRSATAAVPMSQCPNLCKLSWCNCDDGNAPRINFFDMCDDALFPVYELLETGLAILAALSLPMCRAINT